MSSPSDADNILLGVFAKGDDSLCQPSEKIIVIVKEIDLLKSDLKIFLNNCGFNLTDMADESILLSSESDELVHELNMCKQEIEVETMSEILKSIQEHEAIAQDLEQVNYSLEIMRDVCYCSKCLKNYEDFRKNHHYLNAVESLVAIRDFLECPTDGFQALTICHSIKSATFHHWEDFIRELSTQFDNMIFWKHSAASSSQIYNINICICEDSTQMDILLALSKSNQLMAKISDFAQFLLKEILIPIIHHESTATEETEELLTIAIYDKHDQKPAFDAVIRTMTYIFNFLSKKLNIQVDTSETLMSTIGKEICEDFGDVLIRDCLVHTIPSSAGEMKQYGQVNSAVESFQNFLTSINFFPKENFSIMQYANNLDVLFANKTSQYFLSSAREIMLKDLSSSMSVGVESVPMLEEKPVKLEENIVEALMILENAVPQSLFYFPRCMISRSAQELLDLVHVMMEQAAQCSDLASRRLYITARLLFELYDAVVPYHHDNFLLTIPQYVALFHNNCMYLAHNLLTLGEKWSLQLAERHIDYPVSFIDLVPKLRSLAYKHLTIHMQQQRKQILDNIRSSDLNCIVVKDVLGENAEQAVRQCLRQLQLVKNVWIGVFPPNVFKRLMACLVNMFLEELIHRVCTVEDISAEMATQLMEMYTIVVKKAPNLFKKENDIDELVKSWVKLQELILVLGGSLKDIEKRWCDGEGPLALHFRVEELRSLIKALFQNTQFRANLLSKIK